MRSRLKWTRAQPGPPSQAASAGQGGLELFSNFLRGPTAAKKSDPRLFLGSECVGAKAKRARERSGAEGSPPFGELRASRAVSRDASERVRGDAAGTKVPPPDIWRAREVSNLSWLLWGPTPTTGARDPRLLLGSSAENGRGRSPAEAVSEAPAFADCARCAQLRRVRRSHERSECSAKAEAIGEGWRAREVSNLRPSA